MTNKLLFTKDSLISIFTKQKYCLIYFIVANHIKVC